MGKWVAVDICVECHKPLSHNQIVYSDGVCPHCGSMSRTRCVNKYGMRLVNYYTDKRYRESIVERLRKWLKRT